MASKQDRENAARADATKRALFLNQLAELGEERARINGQLGENSRKIQKAAPGAIAAGIPISQIATLTGISRPTVYELVERARS